MKRRAGKLIMHLDGDAFFVSVEAVKNPPLRGKPVVTGKERGIASALSYEAKKLGITRAMPIFQIRREFSQVAVVESDYESYAIFSRRMMDIVRRYTDAVEEYSIDECFADFSETPGFADNFPEGARTILAQIKADIRKELGISVSLGVGSTKVLAKTASKSSKPDGLTIVTEDFREALLDKTPVDKVWGIGSATAISLRKKGVSTALELARKSEDWVRENFSKPMVEMWHELRGTSVRPVGEGGEDQKSIMKTRTFVPASSERAYVFSEISKNLENACHRARELGLAAREFSVHLKTREFSYARNWCRLGAASNNPAEIIPEARKLFDRIFVPGTLYRATGVTLLGLIREDACQDDLFGASRDSRAVSGIFKAVDRVNRRYGRNVVRLASSERAFAREEREEKREAKKRSEFLPNGFSRRLSVPYLGDAFSRNPQGSLYKKGSKYYI
ncbi:MAG TPA: DNA polymerase IV [Candidatus Paceibacterota bacterium]|nr:DNA polymerase IV [Candidatus Paceibacterota bacterium]